VSGGHRFGRWQRVRHVAFLGIVGAVALAGPASAAGADSDVTKGAFHAFAAGAAEGMHIHGDAVMIRTPANRTVVVVIVMGLAPNTTYGAHVHKQACANGDADGHYKFDSAGPVDSVNEIWPGFTTNPSGIGIGFAQNVGIAGSSAVSVVIHAPGGAKIACADLK